MGKRIDLYLPESYLVRTGQVRPRPLSVPLSDLAHNLGGRAVKPDKVEFIGPDGKTPIIIVGAGVTEAAEIQDIAERAYEKEGERLKRDGNVFERAHELRRESGFWDVSEFDSALRNALRDRIARHKANPRTDPPRIPGREE